MLLGVVFQFLHLQVKLVTYTYTNTNIHNTYLQINILCSFVKCGYAGSHFPAHIFPSMVSTTQLHLGVFIFPSFYEGQNRKHLLKTSIISLQVGRPIIRAATRVDDVEVLHHHHQPYPSLPSSLHYNYHCRHHSAPPLSPPPPPSHYI